MKACAAHCTQTQRGAKEKKKRKKAAEAEREFTSEDYGGYST